MKTSGLPRSDRFLPLIPAQPIVPRLLAVLACVLVHCRDASLLGASIVTLKFDDQPHETRIVDQYALSGVHFLNDYRPGSPYRASPRVVALPQARSSPNVLANDYFDREIYTSAGAPMMLWFEQPVAGVGMWLGTVEGDASPCPGPVPAAISVFDCAGTLIGTRTVQISAAFDTPLEIDDPQGRIQKVIIDYGVSLCPEAIDEFAFLPSGVACGDKTPPIVAIVSHGSDVVNTPLQIIEGTVTEPGIVKSLRMNGMTIPFFLESSSAYSFSAPIQLHEGNNTVTVVAENASGLKGSAQAVVSLGLPASAVLSEFHLTQRGVVKSAACDLDAPFVCGKSALVRARLDVKTGNGTESYATAVELLVWRKTPAGDEPVSSFFASVYSSFLTMFQSPSQMTALHFWIPGDTFSEPGEYRFAIQPYVGPAPFGGVLHPPCPAAYVQFERTDSLRLLILPVEAGMNSPSLQTTTHAQDAFDQLASLSRTFPVSDGIAEMGSGMEAGLYYLELPPFELSDGSAEMMQRHPAIYEGQGWIWRFIDKDPGGQLRRADDADVLDALMPSCDPNNQNIGGRIASTNTFTLAFDPALGIFRGGAHPSWNGAKHTTPMDEDHDGDIDQADMAHYIASFLDTQSGTWLTDLGQFQPQETFRFFRDQNGNNCNDPSNEPQADIRQLWNHGQNLLWRPTAEAFNAYNQARPGVVNDATLVTLWFPKALTAFDHPEFGSYGPGQGESPGEQTWIVLRSASTMPHEVGHNVGGFDDLYRPGIDPAPDDLVTKESAVEVYIGRVSVPAAQVFAAMGGDMASDRVVHWRTHYQTLFDRLKLPATQSLHAAGREDRLLVLTGWIDPAGRLSGTRTWLGRDLELTPSSGPYTLVFGGDNSLLEHNFAVPSVPTPPEGFEDWPRVAAPLRVVAPFPPETQWLEVRHGRSLLARFELSATAPTVQLLAPNGGESFGANDETIVRWISRDADRDALRHDVLFSKDGGEHWTVLASGIAGQEFRWPIRHSPGTSGRSGLIRVSVSDGFLDAQDDSDQPFEIAGKAPQAAILEPRDGSVFLQCESIFLRGAARDPEGLPLLYHWTIDHVPVGTSASVLLAPQRPGARQIRFYAVDRQGLTVERSIAISILPDADCDGMSDEFETQHSLQGSLVEDSAWDSDQDGLINFDEARLGVNPRNADTDGDGFLDGVEVATGSDPADRNITPNTSPPPKLYIGRVARETIRLWWSRQHSAVLQSSIRVEGPYLESEWQVIEQGETLCVDIHPGREHARFFRLRRRETAE